MFSPLALTQVLPFLPLAQGDIDYQVEQRDTPHLIEQLLDVPSTRAILVRSGKLAVPHGQAHSRNNTRMRLSTLPGAYVREALREAPQAIAAYLGCYSGARDEHVITVDITDVPCDSESVFASAIQRFDWVDLRDFAPRASGREVGQATTALSLASWYAYQHHCPFCGAPVESTHAGWAQRCTNEADGYRLLFPRVEPAVIATVVDANNRLLIQHNRAWKNPLLYSVSAGFVEAGENLEHAVRRETLEETGIKVGAVTYLGSQPWPFRASLMVAFKAQALSTDIHVDGQETVDARWVTRDEYTQELIMGTMCAPGKATIARYMIEEWYGRPLE